MNRALLSIAVCACVATDAHGQPVPEQPSETTPVATPGATNVTLTPVQADPATCPTLDLTPGALLFKPAGGLSAPLPWTEFVVEGDLLDSQKVVHDLFAPTLAQFQTTLTGDKFPEIARVATKFGYQLLAIVSRGNTLVVRLAPLPLVRKVDVDVDQTFFQKLLDEEVRRRMRLRTGTQLPYDSVRRQCAMIEEKKRIQQFLFDEGFYEAKATVKAIPYRTYTNIEVRVELGPEYHMGRVFIRKPASLDNPNKPEPLAISDADIRAKFYHPPTCIGLIGWCFGDPPCRRAQHQEDLQAVKEMFQQRGFPGVRVQSTFDSAAASQRDTRNKTCTVTITIDPRRQLHVDFVGHDQDAVPNDQLARQLTFNEAGSSDDVEATNSARAITTYLQQRGFFDAHVTWSRERYDATSPSAAFDRIVFAIDLGRTRVVESVQFDGNHAIVADKLKDVVATKQTSQGFGGFFGPRSAANSSQLALDVERIKEAYRREGYRETRVKVTASIDADALDNPALTAPLVQANANEPLRVRFTIDEGDPTLLTTLEVVAKDKSSTLAPAMCDQILRQLGDFLETEEDKQQHKKAKAFSARADKQRCVAVAPQYRFRSDDIATAGGKLRDWMFRTGRPRATVDLVFCSATSGPDECKPLAPNEHRALARFEVGSLDDVDVGEVVIRGNFRTKSWVIREELGVDKGDRLTSQSLAEGARRLRNTGLFDAVNIDFPDLANSGSTANAVVRIDERYDHTVQLGAAIGGSTYNGVFLTLDSRQMNLFGRGASLVLSGTAGTKILSGEGTVRIPQWLIRHVLPFDFETELNAFYREQDTPRFGRLETYGFSVALQRRFSQFVIGALRYDFKVRGRNVFALRPIGTDMDQSQVPVDTRTGAVGLTIDWDRRVDRNGVPQPLAPESGFRVEAGVSFASPELLGQDRFLKVSGVASKFFALPANIVLRADLRYDEGFPLGGAVLLPEVERYFAGGDSTVRGYADDRLATEIVQVGVPPLDTVSQIRVNPAGGNIRVLGSLDAQMRIKSILAGAVFTDAGLISNQWTTVRLNDVRPSVGMGLRFLTPFGIGAVEYAVPLRVQLGDDPRGRFHLYFAARAQF